MGYLPDFVGKNNIVPVIQQPLRLLICLYPTRLHRQWFNEYESITNLLINRPSNLHFFSDFVYRFG